jgi:hypothetical protein
MDFADFKGLIDHEKMVQVTTESRKRLADAEAALAEEETGFDNESLKEIQRILNKTNWSGYGNDVVTVINSFVQNVLGLDVEFKDKKSEDIMANDIFAPGTVIVRKENDVKYCVYGYDGDGDAMVWNLYGRDAGYISTSDKKYSEVDFRVANEEETEAYFRSFITEE